MDLPQKLERAAKVLVDALALSVGSSTLTVFTGISDETKALPSVTMVAVSGEETPQDTGNFRMNFSVVVTTNADDTTETEHETLCAAIADVLKEENTAASLSSAIADFHCLGISGRQSTGRKEDRSWITEFSFDAYCSGVALV